MPAQDAPTTPRGSVSTSAGYLSTWGGAFDQLEHVGDLTWPLSIRTYARMRHDPVLASVLAAYSLPILKTSWHLDPRGAPAKVAKLCADSLGLPLLGRDDKPGPVRRRGVKWLEHVRGALGVLTFGHAAFEPVYDVSTGVAMLAALAERPQLSFAEIEVDDQGNLTGVTQFGDVVKPNPPPIPAGRLLWYCRAREGANWTGTSALRHAYGSWLLKQDALRVQATSHRRFGAGTPTVEWESGSNPTAEQRTAALKVASNVRAGDSTGVMMPPGARLVIQGVQGSYPDGLPTIRYLDEQMARGALASMLDLGSTSNGSRALGDNFAALLSQAQQSTADQLAEAATELCVRLTDFNVGEDAPSPAVVVADLSRDEQALADSVAKLVQAGAVTLDDDLEGWLRTAYGAPQKRAEPNPAPVPPVPPAGPPDSQGAPATPPAQPATAARRARPVAAAEPVPAPPERRDLTPTEEAAGLDPEATDEAYAEVLAALLAAWAAIQEEQRDSLIAQVTAAAGLAALAALTLDTTPAAEILGASLLEAADLGAALALAEAAHQGVTITGATVSGAAVEDRAAALAAVWGQATASSAMGEAVRLAGEGADMADVADGVRAHLEGLSPAWVEGQLGAAVHEGMATGRAAVFEAGETNGHTARFFASEVFDGATCRSAGETDGVRCWEVDGTEYESLAEARHDYPTGQYRHCKGRWRCRGMLFVSWNGQDLEDARSGALPADLVSLEVTA